MADLWAATDCYLAFRGFLYRVRFPPVYAGPSFFEFPADTIRRLGRRLELPPAAAVEEPAARAWPAMQDLDAAAPPFVLGTGPNKAASSTISPAAPGDSPVDGIFCCECAPERSPRRPRARLRRPPRVQQSHQRCSHSRGPQRVASGTEARQNANASAQVRKVAVRCVVGESQLLPGHVSSRPGQGHPYATPGRGTLPPCRLPKSSTPGSRLLRSRTALYRPTEPTTTLRRPAKSRTALRRSPSCAQLPTRMGDVSRRCQSWSSSPPSTALHCKSSGSSNRGGKGGCNGGLKRGGGTPFDGPVGSTEGGSKGAF